MDSKIPTEVRRVEVRLSIESAMAEDLAWEASCVDFTFLAKASIISEFFFPRAVDLFATNIIISAIISHK